MIDHRRRHGRGYVGLACAADGTRNRHGIIGKATACAIRIDIAAHLAEVQHVERADLVESAGGRVTVEDRDDAQIGFRDH